MTEAEFDEIYNRNMYAAAMGMANKGKPMRVFDWDTAAEWIRDDTPKLAEAGLAEDMFWTAGDIYRDGLPVPENETYTYLASTWATPVLVLDDNQRECWRWEDDTDWDAQTYWPETALAILKEKK